MDDTLLSETIRGEIEDERSSGIILQENTDDAFLSQTRRRENRDEVLSGIILLGKMDDTFLSKSIQRKFKDEVLSNIMIQETMDDLFSRKTDWFLVEESLGAAFPSKFCWLCEAKISVPYYTSKEDGKAESIFMHQVCVDLPMEMEHEMHQGHTLRSLRKTGGSTQVCNSCNELGYVYYHCSDCEDFVLDIRCALKLFPVQHKCHQHPLIPIHKSENFHCVACNIVHYGISYKCTTCLSFRVHQDCVSPRIVKLPSHRHDLELIYSLPENHFGEFIYCQICREDMKEHECAYHCARCRYFFHIYDCRSIKHFSKPDPLILVEEGANAESASANCDGCGLKISVPYYVHNTRIWKSAFIHKFCAELPQSVEHHLHPGHDLTLGKSKQMCAACHAPWEGFSYCCPHASCRFSIDIICALKNVHLEHKFHEHPLISSHTKAPFACHACNIDSDGPSYKCTICRFWVHQHCASLPMSRKHDMHPHLLKLTYSVQDSLQQNQKQFNCQICREEIQPHSWAYRCAGCKYYTHIHGCRPPWSREIEDFDHNAAIAAAFHLPAAEKNLATLFFMETKQEGDKELESDSQENTKGITLFLDPNETCSRCAEFLAAPCNNCALCKYFLPKSPAELVDDPVLLLNGYNSMLKDTKENDCNGFGMDFLKDGLIIKISSSVLPRYVKHEGHHHVLLTTFITKPTWCSACENDVRGYAFRCNICDFTIDTYCALLPGSIRHRYDKKHPIKLTYYSIEDVEEYVCEICEGDITTMWFFHCAECDHSIHPTCIWKLRIKFGPFISFKPSRLKEPRHLSRTKIHHPWDICRCIGPGCIWIYSESFINYVDSCGDELTLVPTTKIHPWDCSECDQKEISGCCYSLFLFLNSNNIMTHLQCEPDIKMERWPIEREGLPDLLAILRSAEDRSDLFIRGINTWFYHVSASSFETDQSRIFRPK